MNREEELIEQYKILHQRFEYGNTSIHKQKEVQELIDKYNITSVLDYGCGQSNLLKRLKVDNKAWYDPAIPIRDKLPSGKFELVINTDVLEHIPEESLDKVLENIKSKASNIVYFNIAMMEALQKLPNGENCHCTVKPEEWWMKVLKKHFDNVTKLPKKHELVLDVLATV